ncbi:hypothetical protein Syun_007357 [Stephania yunnanensis]|uniref:XS domain-containing protein n=1 Tax=Stephania yunnanensis TaxID=152371 RepID=A0AAP0KYF9_9MAGN
MPPLFARPDRFFGDPDLGPFGSGRGRLSPEGFRRDRGESDYWSSLGLDGKGGGGGGLEGAQKRKFGDVDERDELARQRQQLMHYGNASSNPNGFLSSPGDHRGSDYLAASTSSPFRRNVAEPGRGMEDFRVSKHLRVGGEHDGHSSGTKYHDGDPQALKKAFVHYAKLLNDNSTQKKVYLEDGKRGPLQCLTCGRASREFPDVHGLIMHAYNSHDLRIDHLGLHKALCVLMGWNYTKVPDNSRAYQLLPSDEAQANKEDLVLWPPMVIIHNTMYGKDKDGRVEGIGNKAMDSKIRDLGFSGGKSRSLYGKDGHQGITLVKFAGDQSGLKEALRLADFFEKDNHGRKAWVRVEPTLSGRDEENNVNLVKVDEKTGEKKRIFYGYLGTASDLEKLDFEGRKKAGIESRREYNC